jgi:hypothetical protein
MFGARRDRREVIWDGGVLGSSVPREREKEPAKWFAASGAEAKPGRAGGSGGSAQRNCHGRPMPKRQSRLARVMHCYGAKVCIPIMRIRAWKGRSGAVWGQGAILAARAYQPYGEARDRALQVGAPGRPAIDILCTSGRSI